MARVPRPALLAAGAAVAWAVARSAHRMSAGTHAPGGELMGHVAVYDRVTRAVLARLLDGIAADVAAAARPGGRVLEVGCGPGRLATTLAGRYGLNMVATDLDAAMIERARRRARPGAGGRQPQFEVTDVAAMPYEDASFDLVVSTFSLHHWADPSAGLGEIGRVLRPDGRALIWDFRPGVWGRHADVPDPAELVAGTPLRVAGVTPWRWPWRMSWSQRIELRSEGGERGAEAVGGHDNR